MGNVSDDLISDPERLVEIARDYFSSDFPSLSRADCPAQSLLKEVILSNALPGDELRTHLFGCSECFRDYRRLVSLHRDLLPQKNLSWWGRMITPFRQQPSIAFASLGVLAVCVIAVFFIRQVYLRAPHSEVASNVSQPATFPTRTQPPKVSTTSERTSDAGPEAFPVGKQDEKQPTRRHDGGKVRPPKELIAGNIVPIDLEKYSLLRSGEKTDGEPTIGLPAARNRLVLRLPAHSPKGLYKLSVVDPYGRELMNSMAASADGKKLILDLDTRTLSASKYRLCVSLSAEAPDCYPFTVGHK